ncbi:MAG: EAL domain-containing protein [Thermodesulfobacteriota bacterium]
MTGSRDDLLRQNKILKSSLARLAARLESALKMLSAISSLTSVPLGTEDPEAGAAGLLSALVRELEGVEGCSILLHDPQADLLKIKAAYGQAEFWGRSEEDFNRDLSFKPGEGVAGRVFAENKPYFWDRSTSPPEVLKTGPGLGTPTSLACLPLTQADRTIGVLNISFSQSRPFDLPRRRDLILLSEVVANIVLDFILKADLAEKAGALERKVADWEREMAIRKKAEKEIAVLAKFPEENPNPVLRVGADRRVLYANPASALLLDQWNCPVGGRLPATWREPVERSLSLGALSGYEVEVGERVFSFMVVPISETESVYLFGQDVTERKKHEEQLLLMAGVFENTIEGIFITDAQGDIQTVNPAFTTITGYSGEEAVGRNPRLLKSGRHEPEFYRAMWEELLATGRWRGQVWNRRKSGEAYPQWLSITAIPDSRGQTAHYVAVFHDITDIKHKEETIKYQAEHDPLTGLPNRALFNDRLAMTLARAERNREMAALLFVDLDDFKTINDTKGHAVGDLLLKEAAQRLKNCLRSEDTVARLGGDEFLIILPEVAGRGQAAQAASRIVETISAPFFISGHELHVGASLGLTLFPLDARDPETLVKCADMAMYRAKELGKNNFQVYSQALSSDAVRKLDLHRRLRLALEREEFVLYFQPLVQLEDGAIVGAEALLRWRDPKRGLVLPEEFLFWVEEAGLTGPLGRWSLMNACRQVRAWAESGLPPLTIAVNMSPKHFVSEDLVPLVEEALLESGLNPDRLEIEVTETAVARDVEAAVEIMNQLQEIGVRLALDDFGTGYSSLAHLKRFPIHSLKIDRSFIRGIPRHADDMAVTTAIVYIARSLNLKVVAEGVETKDQLVFLRSLDCDEAQGYLFGPPVPAEEFGELLQKGAGLHLPNRSAAD